MGATRKIPFLRLAYYCRKINCMLLYRIAFDGGVETLLTDSSPSANISELSSFAIGPGGNMVVADNTREENLKKSFFLLLLFILAFFLNLIFGVFYIDKIHTSSDKTSIVMDYGALSMYVYTTEMFRTRVTDSKERGL